MWGACVLWGDPLTVSGNSCRARAYVRNTKPTESYVHYRFFSGLGGWRGGLVLFGVFSMVVEGNSFGLFGYFLCNF